jgi:type IV pilus assembly protein PilA
VVLLVIAAFVGVMIVGILAAVAIPAYSDYSSRARVSEVIILGSAWRTAVNEHYAETKSLPNSAPELRRGAPDGASKYGSVDLGRGGVLTLTLTDAVPRQGGKTILLTPQPGPDGLSWLCRPGTLSPRYLPSACRP